MVSPSTSPGKLSKPKFPLFNRLLHESLSGRVPARNGNYPECPATAPVLLCSSKTSIDDMAQENVHKEKNLNTKEDDILGEHLDPPKTKLKHQLSIDIVDRTDKLRVRKTPAILRQSDLGQDIPSRKDEVDGGRPSSSANVVHFDTPRHYTACVYVTQVNTT